MLLSSHSVSDIVDLFNTQKQRLLVFASTAKDGEVASKVLTAADMDCLVCADSKQLMEELARGAGALLLAEEVLTGETLQRLGDAISAQPNWSDLPILILTHHGANSPVIHHVLQHLGNIQLLERPVRVATLISMARSALRSRERQYQMREAQQKLQESEEQYRLLFNSMDEGFCIIEVLFDEAGKPTDYLFVTTNPAFEKQTGIRHAVGRRMRSLAPDLENYWFEIYGQVARTGESIRFQSQAQAFGRFYDVYAFRIGEPDKRHVAVLFSDITTQKLAEEENRFLSEQRQLALDAARLGSWQYDPASKLVTYDQRFRDIFKVKGSELNSEAIFKRRLHPDDASSNWAQMEAALSPADPQSYDAQYRINLPDGSVRWIQSHGKAVFKGKGKKRHATHLVGTVADITDSKKAEEELKLAAMVYQDSSEAMMMTDENNRIISVNAAFERITGYRANDVIGKNPVFLSSMRDNKNHYREMLSQLYQHRSWKGELWMRKKNGEDFAAVLTINTTIAPEGSVNRHVVLFSDITQKKEADEMIWQQANFDALTGLPNRSMFQDHLKQEIRKARRANQTMALMFLDMDGFKHVNDTLGHDMGDVLLREAAERLRNCVRDIDIVARLGGDEFTVILSELHGSKSVERVAQNILRVLSEPYQLGEEVVHVSASVGITLYPQDAVTLDDLIKNADQAMYAAKQEGKNGYRYFTQSMQEAAQARMRTVNDLRGALEGEQFLVRYQPIVALATGEIHKAEALIRWQHPTRGLIKPDEFIATAEDTGMIAEFGDWMFRKAATQAALWRKKYRPGFQISVNISPVQFKNDGINVPAWIGHLQSLNLSGNGIVAEITEGLLLEASASAQDKLLAFRDAGIEVALDDFGTGFSALSYLKKFDIDYIKIDRSFVENLAASSDDLALCEAIIVMAHKLDIKVIAEGIETKEQCNLLTAAGCDYGQGYLFSKAVKAEEFEEMLRNRGELSAS